MQPPFLVLREPPLARHRDTFDTVVAIDELFAMMREVRMLLHLSLRGDKQAIAHIEEMHRLALSPGPFRGRAIITGYLVREQLAEEEAARMTSKGPPIDSPSETPPPVEPPPVPAVPLERDAATSVKTGPPPVAFDRHGYPSDLISSPNYNGGQR